MAENPPVNPQKSLSQENSPLQEKIGGHENRITWLKKAAKKLEGARGKEDPEYKRTLKDLAKEERELRAAKGEAARLSLQPASVPPAESKIEAGSNLSEAYDAFKGIYDSVDWEEIKKKKNFIRDIGGANFFVVVKVLGTTFTKGSDLAKAYQNLNREYFKRSKGKGDTGITPEMIQEQTRELERIIVEISKPEEEASIPDELKRITSELYKKVIELKEMKLVTEYLRSFSERVAKIAETYPTQEDAIVDFCKKFVYPISQALQRKVPVENIEDLAVREAVIRLIEEWDRKQEDERRRKEEDKNTALANLEKKNLVKQGLAHIVLSATNLDELRNLLREEEGKVLDNAKDQEQRDEHIQEIRAQILFLRGDEFEKTDYSKKRGATLFTSKKFGATTVAAKLEELVSNEQRADKAVSPDVQFQSTVKSALTSWDVDTNASVTRTDLFIRALQSSLPGAKIERLFYDRNLGEKADSRIYSTDAQQLSDPVEVWKILSDGNGIIIPRPEGFGTSASSIATQPTTDPTATNQEPLKPKAPNHFEHSPNKEALREKTKEIFETISKENDLSKVVQLLSGIEQTTQENDEVTGYTHLLAGHLDNFIQTPDEQRQRVPLFQDIDLPFDEDDEVIVQFKKYLIERLADPEQRRSLNLAQEIAHADDVEKIKEIVSNNFNNPGPTIETIEELQTLRKQYEGRKLSDIELNTFHNEAYDLIETLPETGNLRNVTTMLIIGKRYIPLNDLDYENKEPAPERPVANTPTPTPTAAPESPLPKPPKPLFPQTNPLPKPPAPLAPPTPVPPTPVDPKDDEIIPGTDLASWQLEKTEALTELAAKRDAYAVLHAEAQERERNKSKLSKAWSAITFRGYRRSIGFDERVASPAMIAAKKEYDQAKKRYANATSNLHWQGDGIGGKVAYLVTNPTFDPTRPEGANNERMVKNPEYSKVQAEINKDLLLNVAAKEYTELRGLQNQKLAPREKGMIMKTISAPFNAYRGTNKYARMVATAALITVGTASGFGFAAAAGIFGGRIVRSLAGLWAGGKAAAGTKAGLSVLTETSRKRKLNKKAEDLNIFAGDNTGLNAYEQIQDDAEVARLRNTLISAGVGAIVGGLSSYGVAQTGLGHAPIHITASTNPALLPKAVPPTEQTFPTPKPVPANPAVPTTPEPVAPAPEIDTHSPVTPPEAAPDTTPKPSAPPTAVSPAAEPETPTVSHPNAAEHAEPSKTGKARFENEIRDHGRVHDSGELSLRQDLQANAEKLGWKKGSGISKTKWAEIETDKYLSRHPNIRNAITHDGNKVVIDRHADGSWDAHLEKGRGAAMSHYHTTTKPLAKVGTREIEAAKEKLVHVNHTADEKFLVDNSKEKLVLEHRGEDEKFLADASKEAHEPKDLIDPKEIVPDTKDTVDPEVVKPLETASGARYETIVRATYEQEFRSMITLGHNSPEWRKLSQIKMEDLLREAKGKVPEFIEKNGIAAPRKSFFFFTDNSGVEHARTAVRNILRLASKEGSEFPIAPGETAGSYFERTMLAITRKYPTVDAKGILTLMNNKK